MCLLFFIFGCWGSGFLGGVRRGKGAAIIISLFKDEESLVSIPDTVPDFDATELDDFATTFGGAQISVIDCYNRHSPLLPTICAYDTSHPSLCTPEPECTTTIGKIVSVTDNAVGAGNVELELEVGAEVCTAVKAAAQQIPDHNGAISDQCLFAYHDIGDCGPLGNDFRDPCLVTPVGEFGSSSISQITGQIGSTVLTSCCAGGVAQMVNRWRDECFGVSGSASLDDLNNTNISGAIAFECCDSAGVCNTARQDPDTCGFIPVRSDLTGAPTTSPTASPALSRLVCKNTSADGVLPQYKGILSTTTNLECESQVERLNLAFGAAGIDGVLECLRGDIVVLDLDETGDVCAAAVAHVALFVDVQLYCEQWYATAAGDQTRLLRFDSFRDCEENVGLLDSIGLLALDPLGDITKLPSAAPSTPRPSTSPSRSPTPVAPRFSCSEVW